MISAEVICHNISESGIQLITLKLKYPRYIHAQFMTHRVFSRNAASSRAININKMIDRVRINKVGPSAWSSNQRGMVAGENLSEKEQKRADTIWNQARENAIGSAAMLNDLGVHKQWVNRLLEPFSHIEVVVSSTDWQNFFNLRIEESAQPEIQELAQKIKSAICKSLPLTEEWHLPFISDREYSLSLEDKKKISVARSARVSYILPENGQFSTPEKDIALYERLKDSGHWSPFEHVAKSSDSNCRSGNFRGWIQLRKTLDFDSEEN